MEKHTFLSKKYENEDQFQALVFQFINENYPNLRKLIFHVPNQGEKHLKEAMKLKAMGVTAGIPDLVCINPPFGLELKMPNGTQSPEQIKIQLKWGEKYYIAYNPQDVLDIFSKLGL